MQAEAVCGHIHQMLSGCPKDPFRPDWTASFRGQTAVQVPQSCWFYCLPAHQSFHSGGQCCRLSHQRPAYLPAHPQSSDLTSDNTQKLLLFHLWTQAARWEYKNTLCWWTAHTWNKASFSDLLSGCSESHSRPSPVQLDKHTFPSTVQITDYWTLTCHLYKDRFFRFVCASILAASRWSRTPGRTQAKFVCCCHIL